eukprot:gene9348-10320_t
MEEGLQFVNHHLQTAAGCRMLARHGLVDLLMRLFPHYPNQMTILLFILQALRQLADCNLTRDEVFLPGSISSTESQATGGGGGGGGGDGSSGGLSEGGIAVVKTVFTVGHRFMHHTGLLDPVCRILMHSARYSHCLEWLYRKQILSYLILFSKRHMKQVSIMRSIITLLSWVADTIEHIRVLYKLKSVQLACKLLTSYSRDIKIVGPSLLLLHRLGDQLPEALETILKLDITSKVISALRLVPNDDELSLLGLKLLQLISRTSEGFNQLNKVNNGWQAICQGTELGDELVHRLPGSFQNPGWAIGDTHYLTEADRQKLAVKANLSNSLQVAPAKDWTVNSLRAYMGLAMDGKKLAINREYHELFFELIVTLDMLPRVGEEKEAWFRRLREFEFENGLQIDEMILTVQEMRKRDQQNRLFAKQSIQSTALGGEEYLGSVKPVFVRGQQVTTKTLEEADMDLDEALKF